MLKKLAWVLLAIVFVGAFVLLVPSPSVCSWDFRGSLWGPSYMLLHGQTPYSFDTPYGPYPGIWMPQLIGALFPIGWLPCFLAAKLWLLSELAGLGLIIWLVSGKTLPSPIKLGVSLLIIFLYPPLYIHFQIGQISILITILVMMVVFLPTGVYPPRSLPWWMPLFLALALAKPQLGVLIYPGLLASMLHRYGTAGGARLIFSVAAWVAGLTLPLFLLDPGWTKGFLAIVLGNTRVSWYLPNPFVQLQLSLGKPGLLLWALIFLVCLGFTLWLWWHHDPRLALMWSLALTPIATPYCSSWDLMLLIPLLIWLVIHLQSHLAGTLLLVNFLLVSAGQIAMRWNTNLPDGRNWWVAPALIMVMLFSLWVEFARRGHLPDPMRPRALMVSNSG